MKTFKKLIDTLIFRYECVCDTNMTNMRFLSDSINACLVRMKCTVCASILEPLIYTG